MGILLTAGTTRIIFHVELVARLAAAGHVTLHLQGCCRVVQPKPLLAWNDNLVTFIQQTVEVVAKMPDGVERVLASLVGGRWTSEI